MNIQLARIALILGLVATLLIGCQPLQPISPDAPLDEAAEAEFLDGASETAAVRATDFATGMTLAARTPDPRAARRTRPSLL